MRLPNLLLLWIAATACVTAGRLEASEPETPPSFEWVVSAGGTQHDKTRGIALDPEGNIFLTGEFTGAATFGEQTLTSAGSMDFFVAKVDPKGRFLWVRSGGGELIDRGYAVAAGRDGGCYVTGHFQSAEARFDPTVVKTTGDYDIFVARYDADGKLAWIRTGGGPGYDYGHGIAANRTGTIFVTGAVVGEGHFEKEPLGHPGPSHAFTLAMNSEGKLLWNRTAEGPGSSSGHAVGVDAQGNCYSGGYASGESTLGGQRIRTGAGQDLLVAKFDAQGTLGWWHAGHGSSSAMVHELAVDGAGNVRAAGMFKGELKLADRSVASRGEHDLLLTGFDPSGRRLWTQTAGGPGIDYGLGVALDENGDSFLTGSFTGQVDFDGVPLESEGKASDIQIVKYDRAGKLRWFQQARGPRTDHAYTIASDGKGTLYLSGACSGPAKFGSHTIPNRGSNDIFLAKLRGSNTKSSD